MRLYRPFPRIRLAVAGGLLVGAVVAGPAGGSATAAPAPLPAGPRDYCGTGCLDILPPGQNGHANLFELLGFLTFKGRPRHSDDQLAAYAGLTRGQASLTEATLGRYFIPADFGVPATAVERRYDPRSDVTVVRDLAHGIPHVYGRTRSGTMFGAGYIAAEDRLFTMDVFRHLARGELTPFIGGAPDNRALEQAQWAAAPYTEEDLQRQFDAGEELHGQAGRQLQDDVRSYVDGINAYIDEQRWQFWKRPGEYAGIGRPGGPDRWRVTDVIATASLVGAYFGVGGGAEVDSAVALSRARERFGTDLGTRVWRALRSADDPEATTTLRGRSFPYGHAPAQADRALPDGGRVVRQPVTVEPTGSARTRPGGSAHKASTPKSSTQEGSTQEDSTHLGSARPGGSGPGSGGPDRTRPVPAPADLDPLRGMFADGMGPLWMNRRHPSMSNALVVSARESRSGHPIGVFGSQAGYFAPQIFLQQELQGPGISARGAAFVGVSMYVLLGRGPDYAWSATTAGQDIVDSYAVELCEPDGSAPRTTSMHYRYAGGCLPVEVLRKRNTWRSSLSDPTPAGGYTLTAQRTHLGIVTHRATVGGRPVAFTRLRSTYRHEGDSGIGFALFNDPARIRSAADFQRAASRIGYTFNWFYVDAHDTAYFNSGNNPVRAPRVDPDLPAPGTAAHAWAGFDPTRNLARYTPFAEHPQAVNQDYFTSWNNKQAPGFAAADHQYGFGPVYRSKPLEDRVRAAVAGPGTMDRPRLVQAMAEAATVDLRGDAVLPLALELIDRGGPVPDPALRDAVETLRAWQRSGAHRRDLDGDGRYDHAEAVRLMDAWWPRWVKGAFEPTLGGELFDAMAVLLPVDNPPGRSGSAWQYGWYSYAHKDLRSILGKPVRAAYPVPFCGRGVPTACRTVLLDALRAAAAVPERELYRASQCRDGDQVCHDRIGHQPLGGITQPLIDWANRPTYQMVAEFPGRRAPGTPPTPIQGAVRPADRPAPVSRDPVGRR